MWIERRANKWVVKEGRVVKRIPALILLSACIFSGCATVPKANPAGKTLIESDPPGARIEINSQYVGTAPLRVDIPRLDSDLDSIPVTIIASPVIPGQQVQTKYIGLNEPTPTHVFFDMNLVSLKNQD
jgi:hypothetical protein